MLHGQHRLARPWTAAADAGRPPRRPPGEVLVTGAAGACNPQAASIRRHHGPVSFNRKDPTMRGYRVRGRLVALAGALLALGLTPPAYSACCYFSAKDKDILQPGQKVFISWDPMEKTESWTVQPKFEGNAQDFGMVIPTPTQPKLDEMPR